MKIKKIYAELIKIWNTGYSAGIGRFYGIINIVLAGSTFLIVKGFELTFIQSIIIAALMFISIMIFGFMYLFLGVQKAEYSSNLKEQPEMIELIKDIKEIKEDLKVIKNGKAENIQ